MNRRELFSLAAAGAVVKGGKVATAAQRSRALMKAGCQSGPATDERLQFFARHGIKNICGMLPKKGPYSTEDLVQFRERCEKAGIGVDLLTPPFLASDSIETSNRKAVMLGQSPERDRDIEEFQNLIKSCAKAGIPAIKYNMNILGVLRTERTPGRGGVGYSTWKLSEAKKKEKLTQAGRVTADTYWERITYFLDRVVPVANEFKVRIACHPHDPGTPPGFMGVDLVLGTVDGLKKFVSIKESPYHGLNFCQGTVSEMLQDPGKEIFDVIRWFGMRKKIFNVHFRNIRGRRDDFMEVYPDEGDVDFVKAVLTYKEVGYPYMLMPDHVPKHKDDPSGQQAFAFCYGYIKALIQFADSV